MNRACVIGLGYIGLPTSIVAANSGLKVVGFDVDVQRVERINSCDPVIEEPDLFEKLKQALTSKNFYACTQITSADYFNASITHRTNLEIFFRWIFVMKIQCIGTFIIATYLAL